MVSRAINDQFDLCNLVQRTQEIMTPLSYDTICQIMTALVKFIIYCTGNHAITSTNHFKLIKID